MSIVACLCLGLLFSGGPVRGERVVDAVYEQGRYQRSAPRYEGELGLDDGAGAGGRPPSFDRLRRGREPADRTLREVGTGLAEVLGWIGAVVVGVLAIAFVMQWLRDREVGRPAARDGPTRAKAPPRPAAVAAVGRAREQAARLAAAGRLVEAIHHLLLGTLAHLDRREGLPRSYTSREIVERLALGPESREALLGLVEAVERTRFAARPASAEDYQRCLDHHDRFLAGYAPGGA